MSSLLKETTGKSIGHKLPSLDADNNVNRTVKFGVTDVQSPAYASAIAIVTVHKKTIVKVSVTGGLALTIGTSPDAEAGDELNIQIANDGTARTVTFGSGFMSAGNLVGTINKTASVNFVHNGTLFVEESRATGLA